MKIKQTLFGLLIVASFGCSSSKQTVTPINFDSSKGATPVTYNEKVDAICKCYEEAGDVKKLISICDDYNEKLEAQLDVAMGYTYSILAESCKIGKGKYKKK